MKKIISVLICISILFSFSACSLNASNGLFTIGVLGSVQSFDPLKAESDIEKMLSTNCFEGLLRFDENSKIDLAGATAYTVEKNGTLYTFKLNPDANYHLSKAAKELLVEKGIKKFDTTITAQDYIYGIQSFQEAYPEPLKSIKEIKAVDEFTIEIKLSKADYDLLYKLAAYPVYPRSKAFCDAMNKDLGTSTDTILTNGPYYIKSSDPTETLMERCYDYNGNIHTMNKHIVLYTTGAEEALEERYLNGSYSIYTSRDIALENAAVSYSDVWGLCFNCKSTLGASQGLRFVLLSSINFGIIEMPSYAISKAEAVIPPDFTLGDVTYSDFASTPTRYTSDTEKAQSTLDPLLAKYKKTSYTLKFAVPAEMESTAKTIIKDWEELFGEKIVVELKTFDKKDASTIATEGDYEIAILPLSPEARTPQGLLNNISGAPCYYEKSIMQQEKAYSPISEDRFKAYHSAENALIENGVFVPLFYTGTTLNLAENLKGIYIADGGNLIYFYGGHQTK